MDKETKKASPLQVEDFDDEIDVENQVCVFEKDTAVEKVDFKQLSTESRLKICADLCDSVRKPLIKFLTGVIDGSIDANDKQYIMGVYLVGLVFGDVAAEKASGVMNNSVVFESWLEQVQDGGTKKTRKYTKGSKK